MPCPYCGKVSSKIHSVYQREIQDIPIQNKQTIVLLNTRKMFCSNPACDHKTFSERFDFIASRERKTKRLVNKILLTSTKVSSISASALLKERSIKVCKSSICDLLKKMPSIVDKSSVKKICVGDFAIRKRKSYGTVMVDLITHRIIDLLPSRDSKDVKQWLSTFPNIELVAKDGAVIYSSAVSKSHPNAIQVSDQFHLIKGLAEAINKIIIRLYPGRLEIPNIQEVPKEIKILYNTANRSQRIRFAQK